ncbi:MAG: hypothetical protein JXA35_01875 [Deltaproteobacteria bacterium]|nr:hypothetical protein [Deltaproteobacteria bacterium]
MNYPAAEQRGILKSTEHPKVPGLVCLWHIKGCDLFSVIRLFIAQTIKDITIKRHSGEEQAAMQSFF